MLNANNSSELSIATVSHALVLNDMSPSPSSCSAPPLCSAGVFNEPFKNHNERRRKKTHIRAFGALYSCVAIVPGEKILSMACVYIETNRWLPVKRQTSFVLSTSKIAVH